MTTLLASANCVLCRCYNPVVYTAQRWPICEAAGPCARRVREDVLRGEAMLVRYDGSQVGMAPQ